MSRPRYAVGHSAAAQSHDDPASGAPRSGTGRLITGTALVVAVLVLGVVAKLGPVTRLDLRVDRHIALHDRSHALTVLMKIATTIAEPAIGIALMFLVPLALVFLRRRLDALKAFCMFGGALALAEVAKKIIGEHRPPVTLQAMAADTSPSYPSGHATVAAVIAVTFVVIATTATGRRIAIVLGTIYALTVGISRIYLGAHFLLDPVGSYLCALAAAFIVTGLAALPALRPWLTRITAPAGSVGRHSKSA